MKTILQGALIALLLISQQSYSQTGYDVNLLRSGGSSSAFDRGNSVAVDADGNMYVAGNFSETATFGSLTATSAGDQDGFIVKYNDQGVEQWVRRIGGTGVDHINGISISGTDVYITGSFSGTANFNTPFSFVNNNLNSAGSTDIFLAKFNTSGTFLWARRAGGTNGDVANSVAASGTDVYITGSFTGTANFNTPSAFGTSEITAIGNTDIFIAKFNSSGVLQFQRRAGSTGNDIGRGIVVALNGVYITGEFTGDAHFNTAGIPGTTSLTSAGMSDVFVAKYDFSGNIQWTRRAGGTLNDIGYGIANIGDNVFITGQFFNVANFNTPSATGSNELTSAGSTDGFFARFDGNGDFAGARRFGGPDIDQGTAICRIGTVLYVVGVFNGTANFNSPSASGSNELVTAGNSDIFLARFTNLGAFVWANRAGSSSPDSPSGVAALNSEVYVTGRYATTANFNTPSSGSSNTLVSVGGSTDMFLARYSCTPPAPTGVTPQQFCSANNPTVGDLVATGNNINWYTSSIGGTPLALNTPLVNGVTIYASQTKNGCESDDRLAIAVQVLTTIPSPTGDANQFFCNDGSQNLISSLSVNGQNILWYANASGGSPLNTSNPLANGTTYYASQTIDGCQSTTRLAVTVTITNTPPTPVATSPQSFCTINSPTLADVVISGLNIQWYSTSGTTNPIPTSTPLVNGTNYYARQSINGCSSPPIVVQTVLTTQPAAPTGASPQSFCASSSPQVSDLVASGTNIQWYSSPTGGTALASSTDLVNGTIYYASQFTGSCESATRLAVTANLTTVPAPTGNNPQEFCAADGPFFISDLVANGTAIQWYSSINGVVPSNPGGQISNGSTYFASQTVNGCESSTRLEVAVSIVSTPSPVGANPQSFCSSSNPTVGDLVATGNNVEWYSVSSGGSPLSPSSPLVNGNYFASQTINGCPSAVRLYVLVELNSIIPPPTASNTQTFCSADSPTLNDIAVSGSTILWYAAPSGGSPISSSTPIVSGTTYYASQTITGCESTSRVAVLTQITSTPNPPSGNSIQSFCAGSTPVIADLQTIPIAANWYDIPSGGSPISGSTAIVDGATYYGTSVFMGCESAPFEVTVSINPIITAPTGNALQSFCAAAGVFYRIQDLTATGTSINWYTTMVGGTPLDPLDILTNGGTYYASQTVNGCESTNRLEVNVQIISTPSPSGSLVQFFCSQNNPTVGNLSASGTSVVWYNSGTGGSILPNATALSNGTLYYASQTINGCPSEFRLGVEVVITTTPTPSGNSVQEFCNTSNPTIADLYTIETNVDWYSTNAGGSPLSPGLALIDGNTYYASQSINGCESPTRLAVTVSFISASPAPNGAASQSFCAQNNPTISSIDVTGVDIQWFNDPLGSSPISAAAPLSDGLTYYASQNILGCPSGSLLGVTVTVVPTPNAPTGATSQSFCENTDPLLSDVVLNQTNIVWYDSPSGGNILLGNVLLADGVTYYAAQVEQGCESMSRLPVTINLNASPNAPTGASSQYFCSQDNPTVGSLTATGTAINWYENFNSTTALGSNLPLVDGALYYASQTLNGCESEDRLQILVIINPSPNPPTGNTPQSFCSSLNAAVADLEATGTSIEWFATNAGGTALSNLSSLTNGTSYFAQQTVNGCTSVNRLEVIVSIVNSPNDAVNVDNETITSLEDNANYQWINCLTNQPILGETQQTFVATESGSYAVEITKDGCSATSACSEITILGLQLMENTSFTIYPNPASDFMFLKGDISSASSSLKVIDISGKDISNSISTSTLNEEIKINTEVLSSGIYYLIITNNKVSARIKFTINR
jgi:hypothetical protein